MKNEYTPEVHMFSITENFQAAQVNSSNLENYYVTNPLQTEVISLNPWQKQEIFFAELDRLRDKMFLSAYMVASYLIRHVNNDTSTAYHSIARISKDTHIPYSTIKYALAHLRKLGFIKTRQQNRINGQWGTNETRLNCSLLTVANLGCPQTTIIKKDLSINTKSENTFSPVQKVFELTLTWSPNRRTIDNIERIFGFDFDRRASELRSFLSHLLKTGKKHYTDSELNAMYYHFCRTTVQREKQFTEKGKRFMPMELRRNLAEQLAVSKMDITTLPAPDIPVDNRINESQATQLKNILTSKKAFKAPAMIPWKLQAYKELTKKPDDDLLEAEFQRQKNEGLI